MGLKRRIIQLKTLIIKLAMKTIIKLCSKMVTHPLKALIHTGTLSHRGTISTILSYKLRRQQRILSLKSSQRSKNGWSLFHTVQDKGYHLPHFSKKTIYNRKILKFKEKQHSTKYLAVLTACKIMKITTNKIHLNAKVSQGILKKPMKRNQHLYQSLTQKVRLF